MLTLFGTKHYQACDGISRRGFLRLGTLGAAGLSLTDLLRLRAQGAGTANGAPKSVIMVYLFGGPSHLDMYDMKPQAPAEYRGQFNPIQTNVPGMDICELMPLQAKIADKLTLIRSMHFRDVADGHNPPELLSGFVDMNQRPTIGSVVSRLRSDANMAGSMPSYVVLGQAWDGRPVRRNLAIEGTAYLGTAHRPFVPDANLESLRLARGVPLEQLEDRQTLLRSFDTLHRDLDDARGNRAAMDQFTARAWEILTSGKARAAFDIDREPDRVRQRYGRMTELLQARRLAEAGVPMIVVEPKSLGHWDHHDGVFSNLRNMVPVLDRGISALVTDLCERGLDKDVAVVVWGEMGRSRINNMNGRDHWPQAGFALLAGGGWRTGQVIGSTDERGGRPTRSPYTPSNVLASLYHFLGIDPATTLPDHNGRPIPLLDDVKPFAELM